MAWFTERDLRRLAGDRSFARGLDYQDAVRSIAELPDGVVATVIGTGSYRVRLHNLGGRLDGDCTCPYGREGPFCKHCVAVGLRLLATPRRVDTPEPAPVTDVQAFLEALDRDELVDLIWQQAQDDPALYQRLRLQAATASARPDIPVLSDQVDLLRVDWLDYGDEDAYVDSVNRVLDALSRLLPDHAAAVRSLLREVIANVGSAAGTCSDDAGLVIDAAQAAWQLYLDVCRADPPDPVELGRWLAYFRVSGPDWPEMSLHDVLDLLGSAGLAAYRTGLDQAQDRQQGSWRVRHLREELVRKTGDVDELIEILAEDLSNSYMYVRIADVLREAGRDDEAIDWLQRGLRDLGRLDQRLANMLIDLYQAEGREADALELLEAVFTTDLAESTYWRWREAAERAGQWPHLRERAHQVLHKRAEAGHYFAAGNLARILLAEDEVDAALQVVQQYRCDGPIRMAVAERRAETHPADAIAIYRPLVDTSIAKMNNEGYARAAELLTTLRDLHSRIGTESTFKADIRHLKDTHRRKRNFMAALAKHGL